MIVAEITERTEDQLHPLSELTGKTREQLIEYAVTRFATEFFTSDKPYSLIPNLSLLQTPDQPLQQ